MPGCTTCGGEGVVVVRSGRLRGQLKACRCKYPPREQLELPFPIDLAAAVRAYIEREEQRR